MITKDIILKVLSYENTKQSWRNNFNSEEFKTVSRLNKSLFGIELNKSLNCNCVEDFFLMFKYYNQTNKLEKIMEKKFILRKGIMLQNHNFQHPITHLSSDEDCIKLLFINKNYSKHFEILPDNWEKIVAGDNKENIEDVVNEVSSEAGETPVEAVKPVVKKARAKRK